MQDLIYLLLEIRRPVCSAEEPYVVPGGEVFVNRSALGHVPNPLPQLGSVLERVQPHHPRDAAGGPQRPDEALDQGSLPCPIRPYQTEYLAPANREIRASQRFDPAVPLGQSADLYGIHPLSSFPSRPRKKMPTTASMCSSSVSPSSLMAAKNTLPPAWGRSIPMNALALARTSCGLSLPSSTWRAM